MKDYARQSVWVVELVHLCCCAAWLFEATRDVRQRSGTYPRSNFVCTIILGAFNPERCMMHSLSEGHDIDSSF